jgi:hypothetical protein
MTAMIEVADTIDGPDNRWPGGAMRMEFQAVLRVCHVIALLLVAIPLSSTAPIALPHMTFLKWKYHVMFHCERNRFPVPAFPRLLPASPPPPPPSPPFRRFPFPLNGPDMARLLFLVAAAASAIPRAVVCPCVSAHIALFLSPSLSGLPHFEPCRSYG